ncbi:MAG: hypothetical protein N4A32_03950 [Marinifilaceae bacterium]|jgi:hypothetical protein|nr:hypothetical protein [Marinifilaceae bacterium]
MKKKIEDFIEISNPENLHGGSGINIKTKACITIEVNTCFSAEINRCFALEVHCEPTFILPTDDGKIVGWGY